MGKDLKGKELGTGLSQRSDGRYMARYKGKSKYADTEKEIRRVYRELVTDIENGTYIDTNNITLNEYFEQWLDSRFDIKGSTKVTYKNWYQRAKKTLGNKKVQKITKLDIKKLQSELVKKRNAASTVNFTITLLFGIFKSAKDDGIILINPCESVKSLKQSKKDQAVNTIHRALTTEEQKIFIDEVRTSEEWYYNIVEFMLCTGIRTGEARGLQWRDIDYKNNVIHIRNNMIRDENNKRVNSTPKTETSMRDIPMTENIKEILNRQRKQCNALFGNIQNINSVIFVSPRGNILANNALLHVFSRVFKRLAKKGIHIERVTPHALRDTFATRAIENGMNPQTLKKILGHSSLAMTMDLYAHVLPNTMQEEMEKIAKAF